MELMREETFRPGAAGDEVLDDDEALPPRQRLDHGTHLVRGRKTSEGKRIAAQLESGVTTINDHLYTHGQSETLVGRLEGVGRRPNHSALGLER
jgi:succinate-semialdehyde dehydrogenase/glutarate-semialdehyde dehydrogenase